MVSRFISSATSSVRGTVPATVTTSCGLVPQVTIGGRLAASRRTSLSKRAPWIGRQRAPVGDSLVPRGAARRFRPPFDIGDGLVVRRHQAGARAALDRHVAHGHAPLDRQARIASPAYSMTWPVPPAVPISPMIARMMSLALTPGAALPSTAPACSWPWSGSASAWRARARPRTCRCRAPARRRPRASRCGCRRRRWSCPAG